MRKTSDRPDSLAAKRAKKSRAERAKDDGVAVSLPEIDSEHIVNLLFDIGPSVQGGMGPAPLSHGEIAAWMQNMGIELHPWEVQFVRRLSRDFVAESSRATDPKCPPPYESDMEQRRADVARKIDEYFG